MSAINGLELKTPSECGKSDRGKSGVSIKAVITLDGRPKWAVGNNDEIYFEAELIGLPKPPGTRPYKREEVQWEWKFRRICNRCDFPIDGINDDGIKIDGTWWLYAQVLEIFHRLTTERDASGQFVLVPAGVVE